MKSIVAGVGVGAAVVCLGIVAVLHLVQPSANVDPVRRTISEYALLANGWVFDLAVLLLAGGSALVLAALVTGGIVRPTSLGFLGLALWSAGLAGVVLFPKHNWSIGPSASGDIHRVASLVAFLSLPIAAIAIGRAGGVVRRWRPHARTAISLGVVSLLCFAPLAFAILSEPLTGVRWWRAIPLGAVERAIGLAEVAVVLALGVWALRSERGPDPVVLGEPEPAVPAAK